MLNEETLWQALEAKDSHYDGQFWYGVRSTGIYCRPGCPSRLPRRENVSFYDSPAAAEAGGLRPCKRCRPQSPAGPEEAEQARYAEVCRHIATHCDEVLPLEQLAARLALSPAHFHKRFKTLIGVSPKQYQEDCRFERFRQALKAGSDVTTATYAAGFGSSSRLYEKLDTRLGMTPGQYRSGGEGLIISYAGADTPAGRLMLGATDRGLCFVQFGTDDASLLEQLQREYAHARLQAMPAEMESLLQSWIEALAAHLAGEQPPFELPLDIHGTAFQIRVWRYLQQIPRGEVRSYSEVAAGIGQPRAARAVASACAANHLALLIPCHRVIRGSGELGGYRWGLELKRSLIDTERRQVHVQAG